MAQFAGLIFLLLFVTVGNELTHPTAVIGATVLLGTVGGWAWESWRVSLFAREWQLRLDQDDARVALRTAEEVTRRHLQGHLDEGTEPEPQLEADAGTVARLLSELGGDQ
ncbi:MAG: hypothetical protein GY788_21155 [bacterium]|nr:hypothetical protein [bacterium]